jgi:nitrogen fixation/metabolism regulation signal transduction histidine kinase
VTPHSLRTRLLTAFVLVAVPPLLALALIVDTLVTRSFDAAAARRLAAALGAMSGRLASMQRGAAERVAAAVREDMPADRGNEEDRALCDRIAAKRELPLLALADAAGRLVCSHHWPAAFGLRDDAPVAASEGSLRWEKVAEGYGMAERLAVTAARPGVFRGEPVTLRGGVFLEPDLLAELSALMQCHVAFRDQARGLWVAPPDSPFTAWESPVLAEPGGDVRLPGGPFRWAAAPLGGSLFLVVGVAKDDLQAVIGSVRRLTLAVAAGALLVALVSAFWLSGRIAGPVRSLAGGAQRVAAGDLSARVEAGGPREVSELAEAFNRMTAELRESRERLLQAERVAAWREMARRMAHELKNPIFPIQVSIETLRRAYDRAAPGAGPAADGLGTLLRESCDTILQELGALRDIIDEFSRFARMPQPRPQPLDVNVAVEQALHLQQARAGSARVERELAQGLPTVMADRDLLARAVGNLIANAFEAMGDGGTLRLRTASAAGGVRIEVQDTGPGLTDEQRTRLFTPYYTTKAGGTGLGLAIVQGIVSDHGGRVEVASAPGSGTTFAILLPSLGPVRS